MGILDDAIREHLELKRQHGAPEEEVQRQQDEALGPARREVTPPAEDGDQPVAADGGPEDAPQLDEAASVEAAEPVEAPPAAEPVEPIEELEPVEPAPGPLEPEPEPLEPEPAAAEPALEPLPRETADDPFGGDEPFADEDAERDPDEGSDEEGDVLEDTPDFLQETPEHDRLWFEQKPPRDFDFD